MTKAFLIFIAMVGLASVRPLEAGTHDERALDSSAHNQRHAHPNGHPHKHKPPPPPGLGGDPTWTGTTSNAWGTSTNWSPNAVPGAADTATFSGSSATVNGNTTISLNAQSILTIVFDTANAAAYTLGSGAVGSQTLTLSNSGAITVNSTVTNNQLFNANLTMGSDGTSATSFTFTNNGTGTLTFAGNLSEAHANNNNPARTLNLAGSGNGAISGVIDGNGSSSGNNARPLVSVTKTGTGTWTLSGANTYAGTTTISGGTLSVDNNNTTSARLAGTTNITVNSGGTLLLTQSGGTSSTDRINDAATMTLNGGKFNTGGFSEGTTGSAGVGALTLQANSIIDLGAGASILHFAASNAVAWTASKILEIDNWSGHPGIGGGTDQLLFGTTSSGLTASQIAEIQFLNPAGFSAGTYGAAILANGEVVPIPETSTWLGASLALAALLTTQRRRIRKIAKGVRG